MKPHSLSSVARVQKSKAEQFAELGPIAARYGKFAKGTTLPETTVLACPRVKMSDFPDGFIPNKYYENNLEHNQLVSHCCRHPENHEVEAHKSHPDEEAPDIYIFYCTCGRKHVRFLIGHIDDVPRPIWKCD